MIHKALYGKFFYHVRLYVINLDLIGNAQNV